MIRAHTYTQMFAVKEDAGSGGPSIIISSSSSEWADTAWEQNALWAFNRNGAAEALSAVIDPYIDALLRLPPRLRQQLPSSGSRQPPLLSPFPLSPPSTPRAAEITAAVLDRHHRRHPLGQAMHRFLLYVQEAYGEGGTSFVEGGGKEEGEGGRAAAAPFDATKGGVGGKVGQEEEVDPSLRLDALATDVSRFLVYAEAGLRLMWPHAMAAAAANGGGGGRCVRVCVINVCMHVCVKMCEFVLVSAKMMTG